MRIACSLFKSNIFNLNGILSQIVSASTYNFFVVVLYLLLATLRDRKFLTEDWTLHLLETIFPLVIVKKNQWEAISKTKAIRQ